MNHKNKISVFVITNSPNEACPIIRLISPLKYLEKEELVEATFLFWSDCEDNLRELESKLTLADLVIIQRFDFPLEALLLFDEFIKKSKKKFILEIDDNMFEVPLTHPGFLHYFCLRDIMEKMTHRVHAVTTSTKKLADYLKKYNPFVYTLPNYLDPELFSKYIPKPKNKDERIIIGYAGTPTHYKDFEVVAPVVNQILKEFNGKVIFHSMGFLPEDFKKHPYAEFLGYFDYKNYIKNIGSAFFDIGLGSLEDNLFNQCKSNIKFLEYSMYGIPGIWSIVPYGNVVVDGENGILVKQHNTESWYKALRNLIDDEELRKKLAINAKKTVIEKYLLPNHVHKWYALYKFLVDTRKKKPRTKGNKDNIYKEFIEKFFLIKRDLASFYKSNNIAIKKLLRYYKSILNLSGEISNPTYRLSLRAYIYNKIGILYNYYGFIDKAKETFKKAERLFHKSQFEENSDNLLRIQLEKFYYELSASLVRAQFFQRAKYHFKRIIEFSEDELIKALSHYNLGSIYEREGLLDKAKEEFEKVIKLYDKVDVKKNVVGGVHFHLGCIHQRMRETEKARYHFEECLRLIPNHKKAKENLRACPVDR